MIVQSIRTGIVYKTRLKVVQSILFVPKGVDFYPAQPNTKLTVKTKKLTLEQFENLLISEL